MTERKRRMRTSRQKRLEHAGFQFEQNEDGKWRVILPITSGIPAEGHEYQRLPKTYKHLTTAVSAGMREIERTKALKDRRMADVAKNGKPLLICLIRMSST